MFTGIVESVGKVEVLDRHCLKIRTGFTDLSPGESVAVNGVCLTVANQPTTDSSSHAEFHVSPETLERTSLQGLSQGRTVNLERALLPTTRLSGHLVQGHVDGVAELESVTPLAEGSHELRVRLPSGLGKYCVEKGSIALDGISLTINSIQDLASGETRLSLMIIPHTWRNTALAGARAGHRLNVEVDVLAKYAERIQRAGNV